ncbi:MAG: FMN-binding protein [Solobacterium sp.]|nr:FMN-binding protein [Solobacterium sp.]
MKTNRLGIVGLFCVSAMLGLANCSPAQNTGGEGRFPAGTYTGKAPGKNGDVTVEVTLTSDAIKEVKVTDHQETAGISDPAIETVPGEIVDAQSLKVDTVSGATITSQAIIDAAKAALESAGVDPESLGEGAASTGENVPVTYTAGKYTGESTGYNGPVKVDVTFKEDGIESIEVAESVETEHVGTVAYDILIDEMIEAN